MNNVNKDTPIYRINKNLNKNEFYIKRDDLLPISFGGNKVRKALLFMREFEELGCNVIVTYGSGSSNHCRIIANISASRKIPCYIISPLSTKNDSYNTKMIKIFGVKIIYCSLENVKKTIDKTVSFLTKKGKSPYFIPGGGHGLLGTHSYFQAYEEIRNWEYFNKYKFDYIFLASGTGTTQAGLVCGNLIYKDNKKIIGISIARKNPYGKDIIVDSVNSYMNKMGSNLITFEDIDFIDDYILGGYSDYNKEIVNVVRKMLINNCLALDCTYTGKAFWGMEEYIKRNNIVKSKILFLHTGGSPLFFDNLDVLMDEANL